MKLTDRESEGGAASLDHGANIGPETQRGNGNNIVADYVDNDSRLPAWFRTGRQSLDGHIADSLSDLIVGGQGPDH
jgi:hypothetical protein